MSTSLSYFDDNAPLTDDEYVPVHRPINGKPNPIVLKWGPRSQLRWFRRFWGTPELEALYPNDVKEYYCESLQHKGLCCSSCQLEKDEGYFYTDDCCCRAVA